MRTSASAAAARPPREEEPAPIRTVEEVAAEAPAPRPARKPRAKRAVGPETPGKQAAVAGPVADAAPAAPSPDRLEALVQAAVASLEDDKAENVVVLDVATRSAFADRMIVATGLVERQIEAMARHVEEALAEHGVRRVRVEASPDWVLLDAGDLVIHLFRPEARSNYALERMWGPDSPPPSEEGDEENAREAAFGAADDSAGDDRGDAEDSADGDLDEDEDDADAFDEEDEDDEPADDGPDDADAARGALEGDQNGGPDMADDEERPDPRKPIVEGGPDDAQAGDAQDRLYIGEVGDGRPAGDGGGAILPRGEALDGPAGFAFNVTGEDLKPIFPDEEGEGGDGDAGGATGRRDEDRKG
ncbi:ribosome silencing factor [Muricoccus radiodurans]|uniref:ribosome silencing factor n=1 Tax=Muricoccus radiodurans TaxID=2231721 RepID=UPI003CF9192A